MEHTKDLFNALVNDDYSRAKDSLGSAVSDIINNRIEKAKQEIRDQLSTDEAE